LARKILLADDSVTAQNMGRKILSDAGYEVIAVNNGSAALKKVTEIKPDLVVLDVYMPGYSGLEVCQRLKESHDTARIPVLLTVGKLEPFKPEEAQRVRAEAFIVKPFEASELLSALSKLEDKVVPRSEPSRPGRFARAFAAVDESARVARPGDDNGWKNRISFPKPEAEEKKEEKFADEPATYNQLNRDLRTEAPAAKTEPKEQGRSDREPETVDVGAVAPSGLPKDVTQEEVSAITAAVAQMQMATAAMTEEQEAGESTAPKTAEAPKAAEAKSVGFEPPMREIEVAAAAPAGEETKAAAASEAKPEEKAEEKIVEVAKAEAASDKGRDERLEESEQDMPATMATTAESVAEIGKSRWTAVSVALEGDEAGLSLEQEMQNAHAAAAPASTTEAKAELAPMSLPVDFAEQASKAETPKVESASQVAPLGNVEPVVATVQEAPMQLVAEPAKDAMLSSFAASDLVAAEIAASQEPVSTSIPQSESEAVAAVSRESLPVELPTQTHEVRESAEAASSFAGQNEEAASVYAAPMSENETSSPVATEEVSSAASVDSDESTGYRPFTSAEKHSEPEAKPETDSVKDSAAAWANWRQIRDNSKAESPRSPEEVAPETAQTERNAAAVAAGAERAMQPAESDSPEGNPPDVASIVDSVLADLRPKLMQEISRKMAKK
jgi:CheY-like chemotaxis protein